MLTLPYRTPFDWAAALAHLAARSIAGVEHVEGGVYRRVAAGVEGPFVVEIRDAPAQRALVIRLHAPGRSIDAEAVAARVRRLFDLDADVAAIGSHLSRDARLARLVAERPGLRVPGAWDPFELAVRAVLGQQVTVVAARGLAGRLAGICGEPCRDVSPAGSDLIRAFPSPEGMAAADLGALGMPGARRATLIALARAATSDPPLFDPAEPVARALERLRAIPGVGEWTAQYIALRALRDPDAFPASDIGLRRGAATRGRRPTPAALAKLAERWRPWRAYAAQHLWASDANRPASARSQDKARERGAAARREGAGSADVSADTSRTTRD
jgi:AraC family transcriptional regulator, regulatory protein of adaptative response / DNA-3-methyladenine glycosylase II